MIEALKAYVTVAASAAFIFAGRSGVGKPGGSSIAHSVGGRRQAKTWQHASNGLPNRRCHR